MVTQKAFQTCAGNCANQIRSLCHPNRVKLGFFDQIDRFDRIGQFIRLCRAGWMMRNPVAQPLTPFIRDYGVQQSSETPSRIILKRRESLQQCHKNILNQVRTL